MIRGGNRSYAKLSHCVIFQGINRALSYQVLYLIVVFQVFAQKLLHAIVTFR